MENEEIVQELKEIKKLLQIIVSNQEQRKQDDFIEQKLRGEAF